jgi:hypothetical protein
MVKIFSTKRAKIHMETISSINSAGEMEYPHTEE